MDNRKREQPPVREIINGAYHSLMSRQNGAVSMLVCQIGASIVGGYGAYETRSQRHLHHGGPPTQL